MNASPAVARRLEGIQALRAVAVLAVLLSHLQPVEARLGGQTLLSPPFLVGMAGVDLFFVISGFIMVHVTWGIARGPAAATAFLMARAIRIYPLYWLVTLSLVPVWMMRPDMVFASIGGTPDLLRSLLLWPGDRLPLLAVGWTLVHEVFFYLLFAATLLLPRGQLLIALALWAIAVLVGERIGLGRLDPLFSVVFSPLSLEFLGGALAGWLVRQGRAYVRPALVASLAGFAVAFALSADSASESFNSQWTRVALFGPPSVLLVYAAAGWRDVPHWLVRLGDASYSIYLTHVLVLGALSMLWRPFATPSILDNLLAVPLLAGGAVLAGMLCWGLLERPLLRLRPRRARVPAAV